MRSLINMSKVNMADLKRAGLSDCLRQFENISVHDIDLDKREPIEETLAKRSTFVLLLFLEFFLVLKKFRSQNRTKKRAKKTKTKKTTSNSAFMTMFLLAMTSPN